MSAPHADSRASARVSEEDDDSASAPPPARKKQRTDSTASTECAATATAVVPDTDNKDTNVANTMTPVAADGTVASAPAVSSASGLHLLPMRCNIPRGPTLLLPRQLLVGDSRDAMNKNALKKHRVRLVVNAARELPNCHQKLFDYVKVDLEDSETEPAMSPAMLHHMADRIRARIDKEETVFVHCAGGISRSVTLVMAYLIKYAHLHPGTIVECEATAIAPADASATAAAAGESAASSASVTAAATTTPSYQAVFAYVQSRRSVSCPNDGFARHLREFREQVARGDTVPPPSPDVLAVITESTPADIPPPPPRVAPASKPAAPNHKPLPNMHPRPAAAGSESLIVTTPTTPTAIFAQRCEEQAQKWMASRTPIELAPRPAPSSSSPLVSVIMPVHNSSAFLPATLTSLLHQTHRPLELCLYDDFSADDSLAVVSAFEPAFVAADIVVRVSSAKATGQTQAHGAGYARNRAMELARGDFFAFQDSDDLSLPTRIERQIEEWRDTAAAHPANTDTAAAVQPIQPAAADTTTATATAAATPTHAPSSADPLVLVGCHLDRLPSDATPRWTRWINSMSKAQLFLHAFREITLPCPTWFASRSLFDAVGNFQELLGEDMHFFYSSVLAAGGRLTKVEGDPLLVYRNHASNLSGRTPFSYLFGLRVGALERLVLTSGRFPAFLGDFTIWNAGKAGKHLYRALSPEVQSRVRAFCDIDPKKIERGEFEAHVHGSRQTGKKVPIISWEKAVAPVILCVRQELEENDSQREFRHRIEVIKGWKEGVDYFYLS